MAAQTQPVPAPNVKAQLDAASREQARLRARLSPEEFAADRSEKWERFNEVCEEASRQAEANGLTEEILAEILAEE